MVSKLFSKITIRYGIYGCLLGFILILVMYIAGYTHSYSTIDFLIILMYIPTRIYIKFFPCSFEGGDCLFYGLEEVLFASPIYLGFLGFLTGLLVEKLRKKK